MPRVVVFLLALCATACGKTSYVTGKPAGVTPVTVKGNYFIGGLVGSTDVNLGEICPNGVSSFKNNKTVSDGLVTCVSCGFYSPITIEIICASGSSYLLEPNPERNVTKVTKLETDTVTAGGAQ